VRWMSGNGSCQLVRTIGAPGTAIYMGAGPSVIYINRALASFEQSKSQQGEPSVAA
jgi:hypothetical protein